MIAATLGREKPIVNVLARGGRTGLLVVGLLLAGCDDTSGPPGINPSCLSASAASKSPLAASGNASASGATAYASPISASARPLNSIITMAGHGEVRERFTGEVAARDGFAYTTTWSNRNGNAGNAVKVWNVGAEPQLVDSLIIADASTTGDVQISDDGRLLVVATEHQNGSIVVYDLDDPAQPRCVARHMSDNTRHTGVHTVKLGRVNGVLYAFLSVNPSPARLVIVDLSDPANPHEVLARPMGNPFIHDVIVRDGLLFTALWHDGMTIWDIGGGGRGGSPANPVMISNIKTVGSVNANSSYVHNMWWYHNPEDNEQRYVFVGEEAPGVMGANFSGDMHVVDIADIEQPREVAFYHVPGAGAHNFTMDEASGILYAAFYSGGVRALDVRGDLGNCDDAHRSADGRCDLTLSGREAAAALTDIGPVSIWGVAKAGPFVYASDMLSGIFKLDVSALER